MKIVIAENFKNKKEILLNIVENFESTEGVVLSKARNTIKIFDSDGISLNVKLFKVPNLVNKVVYNYFRKSKAQRSYEYANKLLVLGIGTPEPIAYFENRNWLGFYDSFYISEHFEADLTFRKLTQDLHYPDWENILRKFTQFTFELHQKGVEFLDHSPGNTLIKKDENNNYIFYLVDLNRMNFHNQMDFDTRMQNFSRLTSIKKIIEIISDEYSKLYKEKSKKEIFDLMWKKTCQFRTEFERKKELKKKYKFWK